MSAELVPGLGRSVDLAFSDAVGDPVSIGASSPYPWLTCASSWDSR